MSREAMKQALEALESDPISHAGIVSRKQAITALRQALETEQEPVISTDHGPWIPSTHPREEGETYCKRCLLRDKFFGSRQCDPHIVYTAPQPRQWVGLTDDEIDSLLPDPDGTVEEDVQRVEVSPGVFGTEYTVGDAWSKSLVRQLARAIEAAHGIGEKE